MNAKDLITILNMVKHSNLAPTTKSFVGGIFKDMSGPVMMGVAGESDGGNQRELELMDQLQAILEELMSMEGAEMMEEGMDEGMEGEEDFGGFEEGVGGILGEGLDFGSDEEDEDEDEEYGEEDEDEYEDEDEDEDD